MDYPYRPYRTLITKSVVFLYLLTLLLRAFSHTFPSQLCNPALTQVGWDLSYWVLRIFRLDYLLTHNSVLGILFGILLFGLVILMFFYTRKNIFFILFSFLFFILFAVTNIYVTHSQHYMALMLISTFVFWSKSDEMFSVLWEGLRYYLCFIFASTFLLKMYNGAIFQWDYGVIVLKSQLVTYLFLHPNTFWTQYVYHFFLLHPILLNIGQKVVFLFEGLFFIGFFTKKYDRLLLFSVIFIFIAITIFADVFFVEQLLISCLILMPPKRWQSFSMLINKYFLNKTV